MTAERTRLEGDRDGWRRWGPYLSERQWGTVREDYSDDGDAWAYFPHDHARSRAYRWGEDGLAGLSDPQQRVCLALALWNEADPILKERLFGLANEEGNHGEDVKELYYYLDATPTHSYLKYLYKYPQRAYPYERLLGERRTREEPEFEIEDTGVFDDDRYFDVTVEWAKSGVDDLVLRVTVDNRGPDDAPIHVLPHLWLRNVWSWGYPTITKPVLRLEGAEITLDHEALGRHRLCASARDAVALFTENDTNEERLWGAKTTHLWKDGFHERVVNGRLDAVSALHHGTKACFWEKAVVPAGGRRVFDYRFHADAVTPRGSVDEVLEARRAEADDFHAALAKDVNDPEARRVMRQALAGMIWSQQTYRYDVRGWLSGDPEQPAPPPARLEGRNVEWDHLHNREVLSMPDTWEYPWYAAWDLAFHTLPLGLLDLELAKDQLVTLTREWYMHPNGQLPAYEWNFGDVNPPVHAWATWKLYRMEERLRGKGDRAFLERVFHKLLLNFTWWVNRKDAHGRNIFQGGFLGLDNIGVFDRSKPLPTGGYLDQSDGTAWVAAYSLQLMRIALELSHENPVYQDIATKFFEHFLHIAEAMTKLGGKEHGLWDEDDGFFYDALHLPGREPMPLRVRSMVGLLPLFAVEVLEPEELARAPEFTKRLEWFLGHRPDLAALVSRWSEPGRGEKRLLSLLRGSRMKRLFRRMLDESEFLSPYGIRALSRHHEANPYRVSLGGQTLEVRYEPGESSSGLFGGNSNWRGPIWFPVNFLLIDAMHEYHRYYGDDFRIECPTGSGRYVSIAEAANEVSRRLVSIFLPEADGVRPFARQYARFARDPHFKDHLLFHEYFHGDTGRGVGAMHQTGWTGLVACLIAGIGADGK
ncbi:MAG: glucosidase [Sandaracinaceae bacterium]|nr:glucosidase [Sandaracinaceae bacterium]